MDSAQGSEQATSANKAKGSKGFMALPRGVRVGRNTFHISARGPLAQGMARDRIWTTENSAPYVTS